MEDVLTITLKDLRFNAQHGLFPEERLVGNEFIMGLKLEYSPKGETPFEIQEVINYAEVYELVKEEVKIARPLLETLVMQISEKIFESYPKVSSVAIEITKCHPPIARFTGQVSVKYFRKR